MEYVNHKDCHLMIWETNPQKRNLNNVVKLNLLKKNNVSVGDVISCLLDLKGDRWSCYTVTEVLEVRPSSLSGMNYVIAKTQWGIRQMGVPVKLSN